MILRRLTQHIEDQNWFAVAVDFLIVVVGVFIGIQVANWNDAKSERVLEQQVLIHIADDIKLDRVQLANGLNFARQNIVTANYVFELAGLDPVTQLKLPMDEISALDITASIIPAPIEPVLSDMDRLWSTAVLRFYPTQSTSALDSLTAAGNLSLVKDADIVRQLQLYRQLWLGLERSQDSTLKAFRDQTLFVGQKFGLSPFSDVAPDELATLIADNPELAGALMTLTEYTILHLRQIESQDKRADELLASLQQRRDTD
ncbi:hypothetical protein GCM10007853_01220 [Algimonas ampicilliniresistens]|uniref:Uncharacterized protein n=1 Tax=Algimonas ampicilliniresistens TaxID=1298735 RepID=A0ABQ5V406_9PROT|nr:hypothetical protein [Algimonas ampicilliniresistens]GLQ22248.1 hypothetical protein GCM10007853_01220 [Algimonas ampicilliniresistens]